MPPNRPRWLDVVRHEVRGLRTPYLLVLQHHEVLAPTRLTAPLVAPLLTEPGPLRPIIDIDGRAFEIRMLDINPVPARMLSETVVSALDLSDAITNALDIILYGFPVGRPRLP